MINSSVAMLAFPFLLTPLPGMFITRILGVTFHSQPIALTTSPIWTILYFMSHTDTVLGHILVNIVYIFAPSKLPGILFFSCFAGAAVAYTCPIVVSVIPQGV